MKKILVMAIMAMVITTMAAASDKKFMGTMFHGSYEFSNTDILEIQYYNKEDCTYIRVWKTHHGKVVEILYPEAQG